MRFPCRGESRFHNELADSILGDRHGILYKKYYICRKDLKYGY